MASEPPRRGGPLRVLLRALRIVLLALAAAVLFIEEWGWRPLTAAAAYIGRWPPFARVESLIRRVRPRVALVLFLVPALALFPVKLAALWLIHAGQAALGITVIVLAKVLGTALVGRLFLLTQAQLMTFPWFVRAWTWWRATKARVSESVRRSAPWRAARHVVGRLRMRWRRLRRRGDA